MKKCNQVWVIEFKTPPHKTWRVWELFHERSDACKILKELRGSDDDKYRLTCYRAVR